MNGYELSRKWFDFAFENPEKISTNHVAIYFFAIEHNNRLGWRIKFGFPSQMTMDAIGIKKHSTYIRYFNDLVEWGFFKLIQKSQNQYSSNIISLTSDIPKIGKALDKAIMNHRDKQGDKQSKTIGQSKRSIDKQLKQSTTKPETTKLSKRGFTPPTYQELNDYFFEKIQSSEISRFEAEKFIDFYASKGWMIGKNKMKDWKAAVRNWIKGIKKDEKNKRLQTGDFAPKGNSDEEVRARMERW